MYTQNKKFIRSSYIEKLLKAMKFGANQLKEGITAVTLAGMIAIGCSGGKEIDTGGKYIVHPGKVFLVRYACLIAKSIILAEEEKSATTVLKLKKSPFFQHFSNLIR